VRTFQRVINGSGRTAAVVFAAIAVAVCAASAASAQSKSKTSGAAKAALDITLIPPAQPKTGDNQFEVVVKGADGKPISNADVSLVFVMPPAGGMAEMRNEVKLKPAGPGNYTGAGNILMAGKWNVTVSAKRNGKEIGQKQVALTAK